MEGKEEEEEEAAVGGMDFVSRRRSRSWWDGFCISDGLFLHLN